MPSGALSKTSLKISRDVLSSSSIWQRSVASMSCMTVSPPPFPPSPGTKLAVQSTERVSPSGADEHELVARRGVLAAQAALMIVLDEGQALGVDEAEEIEVEDAVARVAGELAGRFVGVDDPESGIDDEYGQAGVLGQGPEALLGIPRRRDRDGPLGRGVGAGARRVPQVVAHHIA